MTAFRDLINHAAARVDNTASTGQAAYNSMALEIIMSSLVSSTLLPLLPLAQNREANK